MYDLNFHGAVAKYNNHLQDDYGMNPFYSCKADRVMSYNINGDWYLRDEDGQRIAVVEKNGKVRMGL